MADDLISRQVAIDAMENVDWYHINKDGRLIHGANSEEDEPLYKAEDIYNVLEQLPSAQPTQCNSSNVLRHPQCANRTKLGNCDPVGGFCTSVPKEICDAQVHDVLNDTDIVSRQAAIDALMEFDKKLRKINWYQYPYAEHECRGVDEAIVKIANLPSAQPEIIRCKDCKYWSEYEYINGKLELFPWCELNMTFSKEDDFCSHAERRSDE